MSTPGQVRLDTYRGKKLSDGVRKRTKRVLPAIAVDQGLGQRRMPASLDDARRKVSIRHQRKACTLIEDRAIACQRLGGMGNGLGNVGDPHWSSPWPAFLGLYEQPATIGKVAVDVLQPFWYHAHDRREGSKSCPRGHE